MGLTSLQVCMDSSEWFQGTIQEEIAAGMDSSSSPSGMSDPMLAAACSRPLMERRLRPQQDQALKCPRCDSTHTKFCYYNNYSLTQPRYFCKTCRRYWTKGGTLRNIPVGGGCRKNKKVSSNSKKQPTSACTPINHNHNSHVSNDNLNNNNINNIIQHHPNFMNPNNHHLIMNSTDLQLSYPDHQTNLFGIGNSSFMFENLSNGVATRAIEFMEGGVGGGGGYGGYTAEMGGGNLNILGQNYHGGNLCSPFGGMTLDSINNPFMERSGLINAYSNNQDHQGRNINVNVNVHEDHHGISSSLDVKPKLLALEWQDQSCSSDHHGGGGGSSGGGGGGGYLTGLGSSWGGIVNGYGASTSNPLV